MHEPQEMSGSTLRPASRASWDPGVRACSLVALVLLVAGLSLHWLHRANTDLPHADAMAAAWAAAVEATGGGTTGFLAPDAFTRAWTGRLIVLNGQYDARLLGAAAAGILAASAGVVLLILARLLPAAAFLALAIITGLMMAACGSSGLRPDPQVTALAVLISLGTAQVALMGGSAPRAWQILAGAVLALAGCVVAPQGVAATATIVAWHGLMAARDRASRPARRGVLVVGIPLLLIGLARVAFGPPADQAPGAWFADLAAAFGWPLGTALAAPVLWAPAILCVMRALGGNTRRAAMAPLALFALALTMAGAGRPASPDAAHAMIGFFGLVVNCACLVLWWCTSRRSAEGRLVLAFVWFATTFLGLMHGGSAKASAPVGPSLHDSATLALRREVASPEIRYTGAWRDPRVRAVLPPSIRAPLDPGRSDDASWTARTPPSAGDLAYPVIGSWSEGGGGTTGEFVSGPMTSRLPMLELWFCGFLDPPTTAVVLRTEDGRETAPLTGRAASPERWKRITFETPDGPFRLVLRDASAETWIAVTAPVELGRASWLARKATSLAPWISWSGALAGLAALACAIPIAARTHDAWLARGAPVFPWHFIPRLALVGLTIYFALNLDTTAGPNDSGGYLNSAKLLASGRVALEPSLQIAPGLPELEPGIVLPGTFRVAPDGRLAPEYPVGFPMIVAVFAQALPQDRAVAAAMLLHLVMAILGTRALARIAGFPEGWAWLAATLVGLCPVFWFEGLQPLSDVPALAWVVVAVVCAWRSRERPGYAIAAGVATAMAVLIRPSNLLCVAPILVCLYGHWRQLAWWILAGLPGAAWLAWYQATLYGNPLVTGYGDMSAGFGWRFLLPTLRSYARWLPEFFTPLIVLAVAGPFVRGVAARLRVVLATWAALFIAFYAVYWCTWDTWFNMRFILPAAPAMAVLALSVLRVIGEKARVELFTTRSFTRGLLPTATLLLFVVAVLASSGFARRVLFWVHCNHEHAVAAQWARDHLPADAVVFARHATGPLTYYTDLTVLRRDHPQAQSAAFLESIVRAGRPVFAVTYHWETRGFEYRGGDLGSGYPDLPGSWRRLAALWEDHVFVWAWEPPGDAGAATPPGPG